MFTFILIISILNILLNYNTFNCRIIFIHSQSNFAINAGIVILCLYLICLKIYSILYLPTIRLLIAATIIIGIIWSTNIFSNIQWWTYNDPAENLLALSLAYIIIWIHITWYITKLTLALPLHLLTTHIAIMQYKFLRPSTLIHTATMWQSSYIFYSSIPLVLQPIKKHVFSYKIFYSKIIITRSSSLFSILIILNIIWFMLLFNSPNSWVNIITLSLPIIAYIFNILNRIYIMIVVLLFIVPMTTHIYILFISILQIKYLLSLHILILIGLWCIVIYFTITTTHLLMLNETWLLCFLSIIIYMLLYRTYVWGDFELIHFYPRNWQTGYFRSGHIMVNYITIWQYWLWFTFIFLINIYATLLFRSLNIRRADIRGRRAVGDKRRGAWPELLTCLFPLIWCINILNNSLSILNTIETNGSYSALTIQIAGFQWGWRYSYGELNYTRLMLAPVRVGYGVTIRYGKSTPINDPVQYDLAEAQLCRKWLKQTGDLYTVDQETIKAPVYKHGLIVTAQGANPTLITTRRYADGHYEYVADPLRLFRATGIVTLPTRSLIRLLATAEDVTHSWAVPGLGIKLDCVPGRLFVSFININREGVYYGQCSELCGWNHYNMPIVLYALPLEHFIIWWELELHSLLIKGISDTQLHYKLLNVKYK